MCGRYTLTAIEDQLFAEFDISAIDPGMISPRYNIAPTQSVPVIRVAAGVDGGSRGQAADDSSAGGRRIDLLRWGLIPHWAKDPAIGNRMINARSEGVEDKPAYRAPFRRQRCLVPCNGFYEWQKIPGGTKSKPKKQPHYIRRRDERVFAFAGLWDRWQSPEGETIESYTVMTTTPNATLRPIHDRMPVIIAPSDYTKWLNPQTQDPDALLPLLKPFDDNALTAYPVSPRVNSPANDDLSNIKEQASETLF